MAISLSVSQCLVSISCDTWADQGHVARRSLEANDFTVFSIFVNPAQFAPHEDLATYPRTLESDLARIEQLPRASSSTSPLPLVFLPSVREMYPLGIDQNVERQKGTFIEVKGYGHQMEGRSRPTFFRGVATVVTKLFNAVQVCPFGLFLTRPRLMYCDGVADECLFRPKRYSTSTAITEDGSRSIVRLSDSGKSPYRPHCTCTDGRFSSFVEECLSVSRRTGCRQHAIQGAQSG